MRRQQQSKVGNSVGVEIAGDFLYGVEVEVQARGTVVQRLARVETPPRTVCEGRVIDATSLAQALRLLWKQGAFSTRRCVVAIPAGVLAQQMLNLPPAPAEEQRVILRSELERFAVVREESHLAWLPMASGGGPGGNTLAFLAEEGALAGYESALMLAGMEVEAFEPEAVGPLRAVELYSRYEAAAAVYVSPRYSAMAFLEGSRARYFRRLDVGLEELNHSAELEAPLADIAPEESELARFVTKRYLLAAPESEETGDLRPLIQEIKRSLQYYARAYSDELQPREVLFLGQHALLTSLAGAVQGELGLACDYLHPLRLAFVSSEGKRTLEACGHDGAWADPSDAFLVAFGLALRPLVESALRSTLNLRAADEAVELAALARRRLVRASVGSGALLAASLAASVALGLRLNLARSDLNSAAAELQAAEIQRIATVTRVQQIKTAADRLRKEALPVPQLLVRLAGVVPPELSITNLDLKEDGTLILEGEARTTSDVNALIQQLSYSRQFRPPNLEALYIVTPDDPAHFRLRTGLKGCGTGTAKEGVS